MSLPHGLVGGTLASLYSLRLAAAGEHSAMSLLFLTVLYVLYVLNHASGESSIHSFVQLFIHSESRY